MMNPRLQAVAAHVVGAPVGAAAPAAAAGGSAAVGTAVTITETTETGQSAAMHAESAKYLPLGVTSQFRAGVGWLPYQLPFCANHPPPLHPPPSPTRVCVCVCAQHIE